MELSISITEEAVVAIVSVRLATLVSISLTEVAISTMDELTSSTD
jgi:hypothetical protein